ncbi:MAG: restriction endonuclease [Phycisphaerae bacterium]|nr:restriction endonuclease [Phycisphaerae bacterium]
MKKENDENNITSEYHATDLFVEWKKWSGKHYLDGFDACKHNEFLDWLKCSNERCFPNVDLISKADNLSTSDFDEIIAEYLRRENETMDSLMEFAKPHIPILLKKRSWMRLTDDYGFIDDLKWQAEINYYIKKSGLIDFLLECWMGFVVVLKIDSGEHEKEIHLPIGYISDTFLDIKQSKDLEKDGMKKKQLKPQILAYIRVLINVMLDRCDCSSFDNTLSVDMDNISGTEYERYCADQLIKVGWKVRITPASGDQGVDLIAEKGKCILAIQCKKYSKPVGNKAIQEAFAGGMFYDATTYAVVAPVEYTTSAKELASALGVHLLHHDDLETFNPRP